MPQVQPHEKYTYQDYLQWDDGKRWEIIDGVAYNMAPAPVTAHQKAVSNISRLVGNTLTGKKCIDFVAPIDVVMSEEHVVQPDVLVVCDRKKITAHCIQGVPDVIVEVLSPSTERYDRWTKKGLYERFGVKEYILVDVDGRYVERYRLQEDGKFNTGEHYGEEDTLVIHALDEMPLPLPDVFDFPFEAPTDATSSTA